MAYGKRKLPNNPNDNWDDYLSWDAPDNNDSNSYSKPRAKRFPFKKAVVIATVVFVLAGAVLGIAKLSIKELLSNPKDNLPPPTLPTKASTTIEYSTTNSIIEDSPEEKIKLKDVSRGNENKYHFSDSEFPDFIITDYKEYPIQALPYGGSWLATQGLDDNNPINYSYKIKYITFDFDDQDGRFEFYYSDTEPVYMIPENLYKKGTKIWRPDSNKINYLIYDKQMNMWTNTCSFGFGTETSLDITNYFEEGDKWAKRITDAIITADMTECEKLEAIFEWVRENIEYGKDDDAYDKMKSNSPQGLFSGGKTMATCEGYANAAMWLGKKVGLDVMLITDNVHAYNGITFANGESFMFDVTLAKTANMPFALYSQKTHDAVAGIYGGSPLCMQVFKVDGENLLYEVEDIKFDRDFNMGNRGITPPPSPPR